MLTCTTSRRRTCAHRSTDPNIIRCLRNLHELTRLSLREDVLAEPCAGKKNLRVVTIAPSSKPTLLREDMLENPRTRADVIWTTDTEGIGLRVSRPSQTWAAEQESRASRANLTSAIANADGKTISLSLHLTTSPSTRPRMRVRTAQLTSVGHWFLLTPLGIERRRAVHRRRSQIGTSESSPSNLRQRLPMARTVILMARTSVFRQQSERR